jgi:hypothetical protein
MSKSRKPAAVFNIESWNWGNAAAEAEMACAYAETMLKELPQEELSRIHAAALEYLRTEGESGDIDELDRIAEAAIRKATAEWESQPQSGCHLSIYPT